jgi:hypothetical protein
MAIAVASFLYPKYLRMKIGFVFLLVLFLLTACDRRDGDKDVQSIREELQEKELALQLWSQQLTQREEALIERERRLDSTARIYDSVGTYNPAIEGSWTASMTCTETNCEGSAIGDIKTEQWTFSYEGNLVVVQAYVGKKLVRVYKGKLRGTRLELAIGRKSEDEANMTAALTLVAPERMEGQREIVQSSGCRVVYELKLLKSTP